MHLPIKVKSPNNISKWQMGFNSAFKGLILSSHLLLGLPSGTPGNYPEENMQQFYTSVCLLNSLLVSPPHYTSILKASILQHESWCSPLYNVPSYCHLNPLVSKYPPKHHFITYPSLRFPWIIPFSFSDIFLFAVSHNNNGPSELSGGRIENRWTDEQRGATEMKV
jgi:hypothetical protein